jgi:predicted nucleotidyltransferase
MDLLDRLRERAASLPELKLAVLFGSTARGQARKGSDVDLALLVDPDTPDARRKALIELERAAGREVDPVFISDAPPLLRSEITRDGILIFQRQEDLWGRFKERAILDWWDWAPNARTLTKAAVQRLREKVANGQS